VGSWSSDFSSSCTNCSFGTFAGAGASSCDPCVRLARPSRQNQRAL
jgi:hypothetical protein